jgi:hypothetical protein
MHFLRVVLLLFGAGKGFGKGTEKGAVDKSWVFWAAWAWLLN